MDLLSSCNKLVEDWAAQTLWWRHRSVRVSPRDPVDINWTEQVTAKSPRLLERIVLWQMLSKIRKTFSKVAELQKKMCLCLTPCSHSTRKSNGRRYPRSPLEGSMTAKQRGCWLYIPLLHPNRLQRPQTHVTVTPSDKKTNTPLMVRSANICWSKINSRLTWASLSTVPSWIPFCLFAWRDIKF